MAWSLKPCREHGYGLTVDCCFLLLAHGWLPVTAASWGEDLGRVRGGNRIHLPVHDTGDVCCAAVRCRKERFRSRRAPDPLGLQPNSRGEGSLCRERPCSSS